MVVSKCQKSHDPVNSGFYFNVCGSQTLSDLSPVGFACTAALVPSPFVQ